MVTPVLFRTTNSFFRMSQNERDAAMATHAPRVPWDIFINLEFNLRQGEHVALIGPTGSGKTTLLIEILKKRTYVAVMATKPRDPTMDYLISHGYVVYPEWVDTPAKQAPRRVIWPDASDIDSDEKQREVFDKMYRKIYREGGWCIVIDEGYIISEELRLKKPMRQVWTQGRSLGISQVVGTQRPVWIPTEMYSQSTHMFFWQTEDEKMLEKLGDIKGRSPALVKGIVASLDKYQVLYANKDGRMLRTTPPPPKFETGK